MTATVLRGDAAHLPLPDASVDLICTSPPYFGLRSYTDGGTHYDGQIGSEATPAEFVAALVDCTREWVRCLKPSGSMFINLGDKYASAPSGPMGTSSVTGPGHNSARTANARRRITAGVPEKSLMGLPWRYALACIDELGLILRAEVIWSKPNGLPESVTDRVRRSHEQLFHFTRQPRYYSAVDEIREPHGPQKPYTKPTPNRGNAVPRSDGENRSSHLTHDGWVARQYDPLGKLPGSVWDIPSQPLTVPASLGVDHFAAFPMELPRRIVLGWSPPGICTACGEGRRPVADKRLLPNQTGGSHGARNRPGLIDLARPNGEGAGNCGKVTDRLIGSYEVTITGYACACPESLWPSSPRPPTRPAVVLDPFGGTGTTALVAGAYGRTGISVDRSADYCRLARWRTQDPAQRAAALQVPKPPPQVNGQLDMYALTD